MFVSGDMNDKAIVWKLVKQDMEEESKQEEEAKASHGQEAKTLATS